MQSLGLLNPFSSDTRRELRHGEILVNEACLVQTVHDTRESFPPCLGWKRWSGQLDLHAETRQDQDQKKKPISHHMHTVDEDQSKYDRNKKQQHSSSINNNTVPLD
jgi:hypothetical protein